MKNNLLRRWRYPSFTVHNIDVSGPTTTGSIISHRATAAVSIRTVPYQEAPVVVQRFEDHLQEAFAAMKTDCKLHIVVNRVADWWLCDAQDARVKLMTECIQEEWGMKPLLIREGGSIPAVRWLERTFSTIALNLPMGQASDSAHCPNERIRIQNLYAGKDVVKRFLIRFC